MSKPMRRLLVLALTLLLVMPLTLHMASGQEQAVIGVVDPLGNPVADAEVVLTRGEERYRFLTNSTGHAVFLNLPHGVYDVEVKIRGVTVASGELSFPEESLLNLTAMIARMNITLSNMEGEPVGGAALLLQSSARTFNITKGSDPSGRTSLSKVPYSSLEEVGNYSLEVWWMGLKVLSMDVEVSQPIIDLNLTLPLLNLNVTVTNLEGEKVRGVRITLSAGNFSSSTSAAEGTATFRNLPSSDLEQVGEYLINATMGTLAGEMPVYLEERALTASQELYLVAELAKLEVRVLDEEGEPVKGAFVLLSNGLAANFTRAFVSINGTAYFENIPLSGGKVAAGEYLIQVFRRGRRIGEAVISVEKPREEAVIRVSKAVARLLLKDYEGAPLAGYTITIREEATQEEYEALTKPDGSASLKLFLGTYSIEVSKDGRIVYRGSVEIGEEPVEVRVESVNFPYTVEVEDCFGAPLKEVIIRLYMDGELLHDAPAEGLPITLKLPHPGTLRVDVYEPGGRLIHRSTSPVMGPGKTVVRLKSYVGVGGGVMALEDLGFSASLAAAAAIIAVVGFLAYRSARGRRET